MDDVKLKAALMAAEKQIKRVLYPKKETLIESLMGKLYRSSKRNYIYKWQLVALESRNAR